MKNYKLTVHAGMKPKTIKKKRREQTAIDNKKNSAVEWWTERFLGKDEDAIAYGLVTIGVLFIIFAFVWTYMTMLYNPLITNYNEHVVAGTISQRAADTINFQLSVRAFLPIIALLAMGVWLIVRSIYEPQAG